MALENLEHKFLMAHFGRFSALKNWIILSRKLWHHWRLQGGGMQRIPGNCNVGNSGLEFFPARGDEGELKILEEMVKNWHFFHQEGLSAQPKPRGLGPKRPQSFHFYGKSNSGIRENIQGGGNSHPSFVLGEISAFSGPK